ncbi:hypothetical protein RZ906_018600, partial [Clostridioides difficile]|nr:hypothetical protein [Clostridioides difficile]
MREGSDPFANFLNYLTKDRVFYGNFFSIFIALVLQNIITLSVNLADNIVLGAYFPRGGHVLPQCGSDIQMCSCLPEVSLRELGEEADKRLT